MEAESKTPQLSVKKAALIKFLSCVFVHMTSLPIYVNKGILASEHRCLYKVIQILCIFMNDLSCQIL